MKIIRLMDQILAPEIAKVMEALLGTKMSRGKLSASRVEFGWGTIQHHLL